MIIAIRLKAAYFIIRICSDDLISLERESDGKGVRGLGTESSVLEFPENISAWLRLFACLATNKADILLSSYQNTLKQGS